MGVSFEGGVTLPGADLPDIEGQVVSNLEYILPLEYGHSAQAPLGMVGAFESEYLGILAGEVQHALAQQPADLNAALTEAVKGATAGVMYKISERTPVDTGTAKASWFAIYPDGSTEHGTGAPPTHALAVHVDLASARSRETAHRVAIAQRQARIAEKKAATYERRLATAREKRNQARIARAVAALNQRGRVQ